MSWVCSFLRVCRDRRMKLPLSSLETLERCLEGVFQLKLDYNKLILCQLLGQEGFLGIVGVRYLGGN